MEFGLSLWGMQSTLNAPFSHQSLYRRLKEDAQFAEHVGFKSLWMTEHLFWHEGFLPSLLTAGGYVAGATKKLRIGTCCLLLPHHDPMRIAHGVNTLDQISQGRLDFGVALDYGDIEFDSPGIARKIRASRIENALDILAASANGASFGDCPIYSPARGEPARFISPPPVQQPVPIWVAALGNNSVEKAARRGLNLLLSDAHDDRRAGELIELYHRTAQSAGLDSSNVKFGILRYVWVDESAARAEAAGIPRLSSFLLEQLRGWWYLSDENGNPDGFERPGVQRKAAEGVIRNNAAIGTPDTVIKRLRNLESVGVNFVIAHTHMSSESSENRHRAMELLATVVAPALNTSGRV